MNPIAFHRIKPDVAHEIKIPYTLISCKWGFAAGRGLIL
jgi:hypothetical protein